MRLNSRDRALCHCAEVRRPQVPKRGCVVAQGPFSTLPASFRWRLDVARARQLWTCDLDFDAHIACEVVALHCRGDINLRRNTSSERAAGMSVTTTDNAAVVASRHYLADYDLHHSQPSSPAPAPAPSPHPVEYSVANPPGWEDQWRRVPAYRPIQSQVDEQRNTYNNAIEQNFVRVMFGGELVIRAERMEEWWCSD